MLTSPTTTLNMDAATTPTSMTPTPATAYVH